MSQIPVNFFTEDISYTLKEKAHIRKWLKETICSEGKSLKELNFIFCSDNYLLQINQQYLSHDTYTDIITFDNSDDPKAIAGDIFISVERIKENAAKYKASERDELHRVIIHGALHLMGYKDKTKAHKTIMSDKEDQYLALRQF
ncbi:rRNA maturation RNase YbeY [Paradesertivirga mongoliensis]|uniref:Endoribonuclease YbeY n=1 Tax=Paradesertivirga mongoliensis TaxID=2100740 RepID=A0ABW4ZI64_9SPHI|nr:rRNA maturation RNase YbeY [Pedobacter mongoliensis]